VSTTPALFAVTVLGDDRPGIVADVATALAGLGCNLEDSTMTLLRGHFAMVVLVRTDRPVETVEAALLPMTEGGELAVDVRPLPEHGDSGLSGTAYTLHVHGADRPGIVAAMTDVVARHGGNIVDLGTRLGQDVYVLIAEFVLPPAAAVDAVEEDLATVARDVGVDFHVSVVDDDLL
jgi:glycine cleavage system transcriptional repressor